jgi:dolichol kinase
VTAPARRRLIHASTSLVLLVGLIGGWSLLRVVATLVVPVAAALESWRILSPRGDVLRRLVPVYRPAEAARPSGAFWLSVGYAAALWFPMPGAAAGVLAGAIADPVASAVGSRWGGSVGTKTWVGTAGAFCVTFGACLLVGLPWFVAVVAALVGAGLERWSGPFDDNLLLAPGVAATIWALSLT